MPSSLRAWLCVALFGLALFGEARPPVILVDGWYPNCVTAARNSTSSFGRLEDYLKLEGVDTHYFRPCSVEAKSDPSRATIEEVGQALASAITELRAPKVDLVGYSMGCLVIRCFLSGKQNESGSFNPPLEHGVRKVVFIAGPHFGDAPIRPDVQNMEMAKGSTFLWDLATWNQGADDVRQVDAVAVVGDGLGTNDGDVWLTSGSITFAYPPERTRIIPGCHTRGMCLPGVAYVDSSDHPTWRIIRSFFGGNDDWKTVGRGAGQDDLLSAKGGVLVAVKDETDKSLEASQVRLSGTALLKGLGTNRIGLFYADFVETGLHILEADADLSVPSVSFTSAPGSYSLVTMKPGPVIFGIVAGTGQPPADGPGCCPRAEVTAGQLISIHGARLGSEASAESETALPAALGGAIVTIDDQPIPLAAVAENRIVAQVPENVVGFVRMKVRTDSGQHSISLFVKAVPAAQ